MSVLWCVFAATVLVASMVVHGATFLGVGPMPGVMVIHVLIFPPFIAALVYANRLGGPPRERQKKAMAAAPLWLRVAVGVFFVYAVVNFGLFFHLSEGGVPRATAGGYELHSHGQVLHSLTEAEFRQHQAYVVRGFSGHWMVFSGAAFAAPRSTE